MIMTSVVRCVSLHVTSRCLKNYATAWHCIFLSEEVLRLCRCIMEHAEKRILTSNGSSSGYEVLQHSSTYCAGVDGSSTAVIAVLQPPNMLEVCACHSFLAVQAAFWLTCQALALYVAVGPLLHSWRTHA